MSLCSNGIYFNNGVEMKLICKINNQNCAYIRYCTSEGCLKMIGTFIHCKNNSNEVT